MAKDTVDYDRQFKEDLERAEALSLESLALEKFRKKRLQELNISNNSSNVTRTSKPVARASSMNESDAYRPERDVHIKSRPRPGAGGGNTTNPSFIAPPPSATRRNSTATSPVDGNDGTDTPDLISFSSPPQTNEIMELYNCNQQQVAMATANTPAMVSINNQFVTRPIGWMYGQNVQLNNMLPQKNSAHAKGVVTLRNDVALSNTIEYHKPMVNIHHQQQQQQQQHVLHHAIQPSLASYLNNPSSTMQQHNTQFIHSRPPQSTNIMLSNIQHQRPLLPASSTAGNLPALPPKNQVRRPPPVAVPSTSARSILPASLSSSAAAANLIDLTPTNHLDHRNSVRVSILEAFDPLTNATTNEFADMAARTTSPDCSVDDGASVCDSVYDGYDPYDFIYSGSGSQNSTSDPLYASVMSAPTSPPPPLPPLPPARTLERKARGEDAWSRKRSSKLVDCIKVLSRNKTQDPELLAFYEMVQKLRNEFKFDSPNTNMGLVVSPMVDYQYKDDTSIKLCVYPHFSGADTEKPITFTCDVTSSVQHVTMQLTCDLDAPTNDQYTLKVWRYNEYLAPTTLLSQYEYVHNCIKLEEDVVLVLIPDRCVDKSLRRTLQDDNCDKEIKIEDIVPKEQNPSISYDNLKILLETFESEVDRIVNHCGEIERGDRDIASLQTQSVRQSVKLIVQLMGTLETIEICEALELFEATCQNYMTETWKLSKLGDSISSNCEQIREALKMLIRMYSNSFQVDFELKTYEERISTCMVSEVSDTVVIRVCAIYRPSNQWNDSYDNYVIGARIFHGTRPLGQWEYSQPAELSKKMYPRVLFDCWLEMQVSVSALARESRLVLVIRGRSLSEQENNDKQPMPRFNETEIGWAAMQFFDYTGVMTQGNNLLSIWPMELNYIYGPAPSRGTYPNANHPVLCIQLMGPSRTIFPHVQMETPAKSYDLNSLDVQTQRELVDAIDMDMLYKAPIKLREVLWEKRHYLSKIPRALPKVLLAALSWEYARLPDLHGMLTCWAPMKPVDAIELLLPTFPDMEVRKLAVKWIAPMASDELVDYLPQLVVGLRHEHFEKSPLAKFLLERALMSPRVAHHLFWLLSHSLPGSMPQNYDYDIDDGDLANIAEVRYHRRLLLMLRALLAICGNALRTCFISQQLLVKELFEVAVAVQNTKDSQRMSLLERSLRNVHSLLQDRSTSLPLSPTLRVCGINITSCSYFPSYTLPLKINFLAQDGSNIPAIFKVGDELQQDMLTLQIIRLMDKLWLKQGLDLKIVAYGCVPTGKKRGMIELVTKAETLRKIQVEHGLTGSFKDKPIAEWLAKHNPSELEYGRAVENFTASCAGYCVVTYILGICDRHNDNIMLKTSGHMFHIDFGKFLGDAQKFGNFKRDRTPFVLTSDMAYVINGGDRPSEKFHKFVDLCCQAFNIIRNNGNVLLYLFTSMASSGMKGVTTDAVSNLRDSLMPGQSNPEAAAYFARLIQSSLNSWFTQFNFFLHNLAQLKFTTEGGSGESGETLSFVPKTYSMATDGRVTEVIVTSYKKCYDPDKYYVYSLRVRRVGQVDAMELYRTYKEFSEFYQKLCLQFPLAKLHSLSSGLHMGRSNVKQVAAKRYQDISAFVTSLFNTADEIAHSDLVYTFFHPMLRDQQDPMQNRISRKSEDKCQVGKLKGQLKLSMQFHRDVFSVMVQHVRGLPLVGSNAQEPSTYVKVYLLPDPTKETKRKTKVVKRNCHPSFMEMLEYRMTFDILRSRTLTATVWSYDLLQENEFLGGIELNLSQFDLTKEISEWYPLTIVRR